MPTRTTIIGMLLILSALPARAIGADGRLTGSFRRPAQNGWVFVHLEGTPFNIGFQHGFLLAPEIQDAEKVVVLEQTREEKERLEVFSQCREGNDVAAY